MKLLLIGLLLFVGGCSQLPVQFIVTSYGVSGQYTPFVDTKLGGCGISASPDAPKGATLDYHDDRCTMHYQVVP